MATKKSGYSAGAKKLLKKADRYLAKDDGKPNTMLYTNRTRNAEKAGINTVIRAYGPSAEDIVLERAISKVKKEDKKANSVPGGRGRSRDAVDNYVTAHRAKGTQSGHATKRKSK